VEKQAQLGVAVWSMDRVWIAVKLTQFMWGRSDRSDRSDRKTEKNRKIFPLWEICRSDRRTQFYWGVPTTGTVLPQFYWAVPVPQEKCSTLPRHFPKKPPEVDF